MRFAIKGILAALAVIACVSPSRAAVYTLSTAEHPITSNLTLEISIPVLNATASLGPVNVTGSAEGDIVLDVSDSGTISISNSQFNLANFGPTTLSLGGLGSLDATLNGVGLSLTGGPVAVSGNSFTIDSSTPGAITINQGSVVLANPTGTVALLLPTGTSLNFATDPVTINFSQLGTGTISGTTDDDSGLFDSDGAEINLPIDATVEVTNLNGLAIFARLSGNINVGSPFVVPEVGTMVMMSLAMAGLAGFAGVRRLSSRS